MVCCNCGGFEFQKNFQGHQHILLSSKLWSQIAMKHDSQHHYMSGDIKLNGCVIRYLGWGQINEHCWPNNVGGQTLNYLTSDLNMVEKFVIT